MSTQTNFNREALAELLERFGSSIESFDALRSDCYEQALAAQSLEHLELVYSQVLTPGQSLEKARENCPAWPKGTKFAGKLPGIKVLSEIGTRLRTESTLNSLGRVSDFMDKLRGRATALPAGQQGQVLETVINLVGEEMIAAKLGGGSVIGNLDAVDRLLTSQMAKTKAKHDEAVIALREKAEARQREKLSLDLRKFQFDAAKECLKALPALKAIGTSKSDENTKINQIRLKLFGELPEGTA